MEEFTGLALIAVIFGFIIAVLWILLPFAVFGIKSSLEKQNKTLKAIEEHLKFQNEQIKSQKKSSDSN